MAFCLSHAGTQRDPPPPPPYWDIFDQWEQGSTYNGLLWASIFGPAGRKYRYLFHFVLIFYHCKFAVRCLSVSVISHGGIPSFGAAGGPAGLFTRWHRSLAVSHAGTWRDPPTPSSILGAPIYKPPCGSELLHALCKDRLKKEITAYFLGYQPFPGRLRL